MTLDDDGHHSMISMEISPPIICSRLDRIEKLQGSDAGFALIAVLSFIESFLREALDESSSHATMPDLLQQYGEVSNGRRYSLHRDQLAIDILQYQKLANAVRHRFEKIGTDEYHAALLRLFDFLERLNLQDSEIEASRKRIAQALDLWKSRRSHYQDFSELMSTGFQLAKQKRENHELSRRVEELISEMNRNPVSVSAEFSDGQLSEQAYVDNLRRLCMYTRGRRDFEKRLVEPGPGQLEIIARIEDDGDFLVTGSAGTGKTLVLLMAFGAYIRRRRDELNIGRKSMGAVLLTYTRTLTKYNRYLSSLIDGDDMPRLINTVDAFLNSVCETLLENRSIAYNRVDFLPWFKANLNPECGLSALDLYHEVEDFLFAHNISREDYIEEGLNRQGRGQKLGRNQRRIVWGIRDRFASEMEDRRIYSRNFSRIRILELLDSPGRQVQKYGKIFIDEVQDLNLVDLQCLSRLSTGGVVMSGDREQSIFLGGFSFLSAGVDVRRGKSTILRLNYRNTREIHAFAALLRSDDPGAEAGFRHGPPVEAHRVETEHQAMELLIERLVFAIQVLGYSPESIAVEAATGRQLKEISAAMADRGISSCPVKASDFSFESSSGVRLTTLHSAKGLDFAAVFLYLPGNIGTGDGDREDLRRNLLYVAATRAMELLWIFTTDHPHTRIIEETLDQLHPTQAPEELHS